MPSPSAVLHKVAARLGSRSKSHDVEEEQEEESPVMEIIQNMHEHPPPQLGQIPDELNNIQVNMSTHRPN